MLSIYILLFVICGATSFVLSGMEAGVFALSRLRIRQWMRKGNPRARLLYGYLQDPEDFLWTILVGNTVSNIILLSLGMIAIYSWLWQTRILLVLALLGWIVLFYALCELLPKMVFRLYPNRLCMFAALPFRVIHQALRPLVSSMSFVARLAGGRRFTGRLFANRDELRQVMQDSAHSLSSEEQLMINRVMDLQKLKVRHVAIPLARAVTVSTDTPVSELIDLCRQHGFSRMPVWRADGAERRIAGLVTIKSFLYDPTVRPNQPAETIMTRAQILSEEMRLEEALREMQRNGQRLAIVQGPRRKEIAIISLQDILKAIFGEVSL